MDVKTKASLCLDADIYRRQWVTDYIKIYNKILEPQILQQIINILINFVHI